MEGKRWKLIEKQSRMTTAFRQRVVTKLLRGSLQELLKIPIDNEHENEAVICD